MSDLVFQDMPQRQVYIPQLSVSREVGEVMSVVRYEPDKKCPSCGGLLTWAVDYRAGWQGYEHNATHRTACEVKS
jgi:hypothetical protein